MKVQKKMCTGFDGNSHEDYIYKNIDGKKYCKACAQKLQPSKPIPKITEKQIFKINLKIDEQKKDKHFYIEIWEERVVKEVVILHFEDEENEYLRNCECCYKQLPQEPLNTNFHHLLPKRNYPEYRYLKENIALLCEECHTAWENNSDNRPTITERAKQLKIKLNI